MRKKKERRKEGKKEGRNKEREKRKKEIQAFHEILQDRKHLPV